MARPLCRQWRTAQIRPEHDRASGVRAFAAQPPGLNFTPTLLQLDLFPCRCAFFRALEQLDRMTRHDRGDRVLVNKLRMSIAPKQDAEIIEPGHNALKLHSVHQKDGERDFGFADM